MKANDPVEIHIQKRADMSRGEKNIKNISYKQKLIKQILKIRYTDLEEEKNLCKKLLEISESERYFYGIAFANVYLMDSHLALGEYSNCDSYLVRANFLCKEYGYDDLMIALCNCAGLYYQKLSDDQTALAYFLQGVKLANKLGDFNMGSKLHINIGFSFAIRGDWETARTYFEKAYSIIEPYITEETATCAVTALSNAAESCNYLADAEGAGKALELCEQLCDESIYNQIRLGCSWCAYFATIKDWDRCGKKADQLIDIELASVEDQFFVGDMAEGLCINMLDIGDLDRAKKLLDLMQRLDYNSSLSLQYRIQCLKIRYWEQRDGEAELEQAYREYYDIMKKVATIEDDMRAQSMRSKIQVNQTVMEYETILSQKLALEKASQLDELTGIYNRRYFNKLTSKVTHRDDVKTVGVIMLDVDYFKQYNDFYGHYKGDGVLQNVAAILKRNAVEGIYVSRYGGDEFVCLCVNKEDEEVDAFTSQVLTDLKQEHIAHEKHLSSDIITVSIGYCNEVFQAGTDIDILLNLADQALYEIKEGDRNGRSRKWLSIS